MVQAFLLPFTKTGPALDSDKTEAEDLGFWKKTIEKLSAGKVSWEQFIETAKKSLLRHPAARYLTGREGRNLLHLAIIHNATAALAELMDDASLKIKRDSFGLTPLDLARFLQRENCLGVLVRSKFTAQPNVLISDPCKDKLNELEYLPGPVFETPKALDDILIKTRKAKGEDQIPSEKIWMGIHFDKEILKGMHPKVSIRFVDERLGYGIFAEQKISPCSFVGEYTGEIQERKQKHLKDKMYCLRYTVWEMGGRNFTIDAEKKGNFTRFINHSAQPNLGVQSIYWRGMPRMIFVALKEISPGVQLTFDYGAHFWKEAGLTPYPI